MPEEMDRVPFLEEKISLDELNERDEVYGYGEEFDELYAFNHAISKGRFLLIISNFFMLFIGTSRELSASAGGSVCLRKVS